VILLTHHLDLLAGFDRVLVFDEGRLVCDDLPEPASAFYRKLMG
jgi:biotin transport system ATP-binding protein